MSAPEDIRAQVDRLRDDGQGRLASKVAVVTGGGMLADGPIGTGAAIAHAFAANGARVAVVDRDEERAERTSRLIAESGGQSLVVVADVTNEEDCAALVQASRAWGGRIDVLVNNVAISPQADVTSITLEAWELAYRTNVTAAMLLTQLCADALAEHGGSIVNISSTAAIQTFGAVSYGASKAALIALTRESAHTLGPRGVRANCVLPGHIYAAMSAGLSEEMRDRRRRATLLGTEGTAWDIAAAALFLASDHARWITGVALPVDAGTTTIASMVLENLHPKP